MYLQKRELVEEQNGVNFDVQILLSIHVNFMWRNYAIFAHLLNNFLDSILDIPRSLYIKLDRILTKMILHTVWDIIHQNLYKRVIIPLYYRESTYMDTLETAQTCGCVM